VLQLTSAICAASPSGSQPSGSTFTLTGLSAGTCTASIQGDTSSVPGALTDTAPISVAISASPVATPRPCDLVTNGKCYQRIVAQTDQAFWKLVVPNSVCGVSSAGPVCSYVDSIHAIQLGPGYSIATLTPPTDSQHELLFRINRTGGIFEQCSTYDVIEGIVDGSQFFFPGSSVGAPQDGPLGFGQPSRFLTINHVFASPAEVRSFQEPTVWPMDTTLSDLFEAVAMRLVDNPYTFTYSSTSAISGDIQWDPDFPACDVSGAFGTKYGMVTLELLFEIFQAVP